MADLEDSPRAMLACSRREPAGILVRIGGELDVASIEALQGEIDALLACEDEPVVVDLAELVFMDSSGIAVLLRLANHFSEVTVQNPSPLIQRAVEVLGLSERLGMGGA